MATKNSLQITPRDLELLTALDQLPLTSEQLLRLSSSFDEPFSQLRLVQRRLHLLGRAGYVQSWPYMTAGNGRSPNYFKLSRSGYRMLYGQDAILPKRRYFESISGNHHHHTQSLAEFIVHLVSTAATQGVTMRHYARENSVRFDSGGSVVFPDAAFQLVTRDETQFNFVVELDNGTERVCSQRDTESIERKIRSYDLHQSTYSAFDKQRYVVLFVTTRSGVRLRHIMDAAGRFVSNPQRLVFLGIELKTFLTHEAPILKPIFTDHNGDRRSLLPVGRRRNSLADICDESVTPMVASAPCRQACVGTDTGRERAVVAFPHQTSVCHAR